MLGHPTRMRIQTCPHGKLGMLNICGRFLTNPPLAVRVSRFRPRTASAQEISVASPAPLREAGYSFTSALQLPTLTLLLDPCRSPLCPAYPSPFPGICSTNICHLRRPDFHSQYFLPVVSSSEVEFLPSPLSFVHLLGPSYWGSIPGLHPSPSSPGAPGLGIRSFLEKGHVIQP